MGTPALEKKMGIGPIDIQRDFIEGGENPGIFCLIFPHFRFVNDGFAKRQSVINGLSRLLIMAERDFAWNEISLGGADCTAGYCSCPVSPCFWHLLSFWWSWQPDFRN